MDIDVVDIKSLRKKYINKKICVNKFCKEVSSFFNPKTNELEIEFSHLVKWSGDEYTYTITFTLDCDSKIEKIVPLKCEKLSFDDAFRSGYRNKRVDEYDYYRLDCILKTAIE